MPIVYVQITLNELGISLSMHSFKRKRNLRNRLVELLISCQETSPCLVCSRIPMSKTCLWPCWRIWAVANQSSLLTTWFRVPRWPRWTNMCNTLCSSCLLVTSKLLCSSTDQFKLKLVCFDFLKIFFIIVIFYLFIYLFLLYNMILALTTLRFLSRDSLHTLRYTTYSIFKTQ